MLVIGTGPIYLSHLPMFHPPHDHQVLLEVGLRKDGVDAEAEYRADREERGERIYTLEPERFALRELFAEFPHEAERTSFTGTLYRGHFERGGEALLEDVTVNVAQVTYHHPLERSADAPGEARELTYRCFGTPARRFLAHEITTAPNFDQILAIRFAEEEFAELDFGQGPVRVDDRKDTLEDRLREGDAVTGFFFQSIGPGGRHGFRAQIVVEEEIYLESGELEG
jgi:hypothetical protein